MVALWTSDRQPTVREFWYDDVQWFRIVCSCLPVTKVTYTFVRSYTLINDDDNNDDDDDDANNRNRQRIVESFLHFSKSSDIVVRILTLRRTSPLARAKFNRRSMWRVIYCEIIFATRHCVTGHKNVRVRWITTGSFRANINAFRSHWRSICARVSTCRCRRRRD